MRRSSAITLVLGSLAAAAGLGWLSVDTVTTLVRTPDTPGVELQRVLLVGSSVAAMAAAAWLVCVFALAVAEQTSGRTGLAPAEPSWLRPQLVRLVVGAVLGSGLTASPALATTGSEPEPVMASRTSWAELDGLPPLGPPVSPHDPAAPRHLGHATVPRVVVRPGDSLWSLSEGLLSRGSDDVSGRDLEAAWRQLYAANRRRIGADPDLVLPGTLLRVPRSVALLSPSPSHR